MRPSEAAWLDWWDAAPPGALLTVSVELPSPVVPAARARKGAHGKWYTPNHYLAWREGARARMIEARNPSGLSAELMPIKGRFAVDIYLPPHTVHAKADLDNVAKAVLDAGTGIIWADDRYVDVLRVARGKLFSAPFMRCYVLP